MDISDIFKDLSPLLFVLLISILKSKKPKESEYIPTVKRNPSPPPFVEADPVFIPQETLESLPVEAVCRDSVAKKKRRSIREMVIAKVILDRPIAFQEKGAQSSLDLPYSKDIDMP